MLRNGCAELRKGKKRGKKEKENGSGVVNEPAGLLVTPGMVIHFIFHLLLSLHIFMMYFLHRPVRAAHLK